MTPDTTLDLAELSARAGVSTRTVRYYIQQGLLPAPESRGPGAHYGGEHLDRLHLIRRLQREHLPLAEIRRRLEALDAAEIRELLAAPEPPRSSARDYIRGVPGTSRPGPDAAEAAPAAPAVQATMSRRLSSPPPMGAAEPPASYPAAMLEPAPAPRPPGRSQWDRITLAPDVELHVRRPLSREQNRQVERLIEAARDIFEEDLP